MELKDVVGLLVTAIGKIEFYWNFYVVMLIALIGWLVSTERALTRRLKMLISLGFVAFAVMSVSGLYGSYSFAEAIRSDLVAMDTAKASLPSAHQVLKDQSYLQQRTLMLWIQAILGVAVLVTLWSGRLGRSKARSRKR